MGLTSFSATYRNIAAMKSSTQHFFLRRGLVVKGPVSLWTVKGLVEAGKVLATDEFSASADGPWRTVGSLIGGMTPRHPVIDSFLIKRRQLGRGFYAEYNCVRCGAALQSNESELMQIESCPSCGLHFRLSPLAAAHVSSIREAEQRMRVEAVAARAEQRTRRLAERQAEAERREKIKSQHDNLHATRRDEDAAAKRWHLENAAVARQRADGCWYCGFRRSKNLPFCLACGQVKGRQSARGS